MSLDKFIELSDGFLESENSNNKLVRGYVAAFKLKHFQKVFQALKEAKEKWGCTTPDYDCPKCRWIEKYDKEFSK